MNDGGDGYQYDVFVSYKREPADNQLITPWLIKVLRRIEFWLKQELGGVPARVFFDQSSIDIGDRWPDTLKNALLTAKCLLPIWSPEYFQSSWCVSEWRSFLARELLPHNDGHRLVVPVTFHDGRWFPEEARRIQQFDLSPYAATTEAFWRSSRADELDVKLQHFAPMLAKAIGNAPPFESGWPVETPAPEAPPFVALTRFSPRGRES